jgi:hypothetical protein
MVGHVADNAIHASSSSSTSNAFQITKNDHSSLTACLFNYCVTDFMASVVDFAVFCLADFADCIQRFLLA